MITIIEDFIITVLGHNLGLDGVKNVWISDWAFTLCS